MDLSILDARLAEVSKHEQITHIDLYGGEVGLLPHDYLIELCRIVQKYNNGRVNIITNLSNVYPIFLEDFVDLSVSYDFECREKHNHVLRNMTMTPKDLHVLMLAGPCLIRKDVDPMIRLFNVMNNVKTVEIKPYSTSQANAYDVSFRDYEEFVKKWIESPVEKNFMFTNEHEIKKSLVKQRNAFSDDHVYITPSGNFGVLEFDLNDNEFFLELDSFDKYLEWTESEKKRVAANVFCSNCEYFGNCLSEHLRPVLDLENSCNGFKHLIDWYGTKVQPHKLRQEYFHRTGKIEDMKFESSVQDIEGNILADRIVDYMTNSDDRLVYPTKSYAVAIIYAKLIEQHFGIDMMESLDDPELLYNNDKHFVKYSDDKYVYDQVLSRIPHEIRFDLPQLHATKTYFEQEFLI